MDEYDQRPQDQLLPEGTPEDTVPEAPTQPAEETEETGEAKKPRRPGAGLYEWLQLVMGCVLAAVVLFNCFARLTRVDGHSMDPTLQDGEMMLIWSLGYQPEQGDIVVLTKTAQDTLPQVKDKAIVKRVIACLLYTSWSPPRKAERANTSAPTPVSSSPQVSPVRPGTGSWVPVYTAEKAPKGVFPRGPRRMVTDRPSHSSSSSPSMGAPDQG